MATGDPYYYSNKYYQSSSNNYLKHISEEREKTKKSKEKENSSVLGDIKLGGSLNASNTVLSGDNITYLSDSVLTYSHGGGGTVTISNASTSTNFIGYNTTLSVPSFYGGWQTIPASPLHGTVTYNSGLTSSGYTVSFDMPMIFENDIIKIKEGKVYINDKLEMNPTRIGLALLKALDSVNKDNVNDAKEMFNKD